MRPTRAGWILLALVAYLLLQSASSAAAVYIVISCFLALVVVNAPYALWVVRGVRVRREHPSHVKERTDMRVRLLVSNLSAASRVLLRFRDQGPGRELPPVQVPFLAGHGDAEVSYTCRPERRGVYRFASCRVESTSPFGLVAAGRRVRAESDLVVYPLFYELTGAVFPFRKSYTGLTAAPGSRPGESPSFFGLREYREGDPIRKIHWPSSLRTRTLMVKEFEEDMHSSVVLLLDTYSRSIVGDDDTNLEAAIRAAASLANHTLAGGHPTGLAYFDGATGALRYDQATGDLTPILDCLARLQPSRLRPAGLIAAGPVGATRHRNCIALLLSADREALEALLRARAGGVEVLTVIVDEHGNNRPAPEKEWLPKMLDLLEAAGARTVFLSYQEDIQGRLSADLRPAPRVRRS